MLYSTGLGLAALTRMSYELTTSNRLTRDIVSADHKQAESKSRLGLDRSAMLVLILLASVLELRLGQSGS